MRVLQAINSYVRSDRSGGPVRMMHDYARHLVRKGHSVTVFTTDFIDYGRRAGLDEETLDGVRIRYFRNLDDRLTRRNKTLSFGLYAALKKEMKDFDAVHICETRGALPAVVHRYAAKHGVPVAHSAFGMLPAKGGFLRKAYEERFVRPLIRGSSLLLAQTENERNEYLKAGADAGRIRLLPLGVDLDRIRDIKKGLFRQWFKIPPEDRLLLFLGRIHPLKGLTRLLDVFSRAAKELPPLRLAIVGVDDGALDETKSHARALGISDRVVFTGPVYGEDRFCAYLDADLFMITPTHYEETSLASVEAMACGTPVLLSKEAEVPYLEEHGAGICMAFNEKNFAGIVAGLCRDPEMLAAMGENARRLARKKLSIGAVGDRLEEYLMGIARAGMATNRDYGRIYEHEMQ